mmetsp:Transcript_8687/g.13806  ORF Transcript_8687/g.13806 Transcript_8687/m.13806 type:complete len:93 (+) Transcript_8687:278-556(+)|eukprot:CAMPEP_0115130004 /NCGR_PEP_ID=MMETSP0227-20121206/52176_1 /TAXON_ID=89957 /ORGANISM="Polarella glacialis, Strain CCMP 1383" /LENGTH=92 /DNA_ID=CAMNT_0002535077 /DNA_START=203 /DNA_END=481 /DNA_ORIENTATION=+
MPVSRSNDKRSGLGRSTSLVRLGTLPEQAFYIRIVACPGRAKELQRDIVGGGVEVEKLCNYPTTRACKIPTGLCGARPPWTYARNKVGGDPW